MLKLSRLLIQKYKINPYSFLGHSDIAPNRKKDPGEKFPWKYLSKYKIGIWHNLNQNLIIKLDNSELCNIGVDVLTEKFNNSISNNFL